MLGTRPASVRDGPRQARECWRRDSAGPRVLGTGPRVLKIEDKSLPGGSWRPGSGRGRRFHYSHVAGPCVTSFYSGDLPFGEVELGRTILKIFQSPILEIEILTVCEPPRNLDAAEILTRVKISDISQKKLFAVIETPANTLASDKLSSMDPLTTITDSIFFYPPFSRFSKVS